VKSLLEKILQYGTLGIATLLVAVFGSKINEALGIRIDDKILVLVGFVIIYLIFLSYLYVRVLIRGNNDLRTPYLGQYLSVHSEYSQAIFEITYLADSDAYRLSGTTFYRNGQPIGGWTSDRLDIDHKTKTIRYVYNGNTSYNPDPVDPTKLKEDQSEAHGYARINFVDGLLQGTGRFFDDAGSPRTSSSKYLRITPEWISAIMETNAKRLHPRDWSTFIVKLQEKCDFLV
jgi:hypothetical protein